MTGAYALLARLSSELRRGDFVVTRGGEMGDVQLRKTALKSRRVLGVRWEMTRDTSITEFPQHVDKIRC